MCERSLAIAERVFGPHHPNVAVSLHNLASLHRDLGDHGRARLRLNEFWPFKSKHWGPNTWTWPTHSAFWANVI
jgi:hypothetical protein